MPPMLVSDPPVLPAVEPCEGEPRELLARLPRFVALAFLVDELWELAPCLTDCPDLVPAIDPDAPAVPDPDIVAWSVDPFDEPEDWAMAAVGISAAIATPRRNFHITDFAYFRGYTTCRFC
jgi:hypothetical protein